MNAPATKQYACARCHETFEQEWNDDEARAEATQLWPDISIADINATLAGESGRGALLCDDCFQAFMRFYDTGRR